MNATTPKTATPRRRTAKPKAPAAPAEDTITVEVMGEAEPETIETVEPPAAPEPAPEAKPEPKPPVQKAVNYDAAKEIHEFKRRRERFPVGRLIALARHVGVPDPEAMGSGPLIRATRIRIESV